jgi:methylated-DNA-[protein]-cysteine S-methyltransferase
MTKLESRLQSKVAVPAGLRDELARRAEAADLIDVGYTLTDSPVGQLLLAATPAGVVRLAFPTEDPDAVLERLAVLVSPRVLRAPARLDNVRRQLDEYFAGTRTTFDVPVDLQLVSGFRRRVLEVTATLPYGSVSTYSEVATGAGNPRAVRAAGSAVGANPVPIVVPCHRVLRRDGTLGGYAGGLAVKQLLLDLERGAAA